MNSSKEYSFGVYYRNDELRRMIMNELSRGLINKDGSPTEIAINEGLVHVDWNIEKKDSSKENVIENYSSYDRVCPVVEIKDGRLLVLNNNEIQDNSKEVEFKYQITEEEIFQLVQEEFNSGSNNEENSIVELGINVFNHMLNSLNQAK